MKSSVRLALFTVVMELLAVTVAFPQDVKKVSTTPPELCPVWPIYQITDTEWVYYAEHYNGSCTVDDAGYLQGAYLWPKECSDDECEEDAPRVHASETPSAVRTLKPKKDKSTEFPGHKKPDDKSFPTSKETSAEVDAKIKKLMPKDPYAQKNSIGEKAYYMTSSEISPRYFSFAKVKVAVKAGDKAIYYGFELHKKPADPVDFSGVTIMPFVPPQATASGTHAWRAAVDVDGDGTPEQILLLGK